MPRRKLDLGKEFAIGDMGMRSAEEAYLVGETEIVCIGCGCTDQRGCGADAKGESCSWVAVEADCGVGLCTRCAAKPLAELLGRIESSGLAATA
jgi:hypothetical protein